MIIRLVPPSPSLTRAPLLAHIPLQMPRRPLVRNKRRRLRDRRPRQRRDQPPKESPKPTLRKDLPGAIERTLVLALGRVEGVGLEARLDDVDRVDHEPEGWARDGAAEHGPETGELGAGQVVLAQLVADDGFVDEEVPARARGGDEEEEEEVSSGARKGREDGGECACLLTFPFRDLP